jgi:hypothetical protein
MAPGIGKSTHFPCSQAVNSLASIFQFEELFVASHDALPYNLCKVKLFVVSHSQWRPLAVVETTWSTCPMF